MKEIKCEIKNHPAITREGFDRICGANSGDRIDPTFVQGEITKIAEKTATLEEFVDKKVAHLDKKALTGNVASPTFKELDDCLDYLVELVRKYWLLFTGSSASITPTIVDEWEKIFEVPWIDPDQSTHGDEDESGGKY